MVAASRPRTAYSLTDTTPARTVWVYRNGDPFYLGRKFVINHRYVRTFEAFLIQLNEGVPTPFGVRNVYTPREGHSVKDLPELQSGGKYVAAGREQFRKLNVFTNGDTLIAPVKILIPRFILTKWDRVLGMINEKVILRCGRIHRLYTLHGHLVHGPEELEDNQFYIACSKEKFQSLRYWQHPKVPGHIRRNFDHRTPKLRKSPKRKGSDTHTSRSKTPDHLPVQASAEQPKVEEGERRSVFYARSKKACPEAVPKELSSEDGRSVFKAEKSQKETEEAQEVQDARDVQIDLPVDQMKEDVQMKEDDQYEDQNNQVCT
ncbi:doublecortin domain-containing protein 2C [Sphaerodactylus townsendi]|uniref:doublecortin domain-containing protein 2C n=1 Tax=Sphaerodactylus townsendi TaxID=933632 RepID=UPI002027521C|nr:doublecortin domain-containing protein 2C [Sphaerodactylus townsendi]